MPPMFREGRSRRSWRREVAEGLVRRVDVEGEVRFIGTNPGDRGEMLRIAEMLPDDVIAELYEDPAYPGCTFMELRLVGGAQQQIAYPEDGDFEGYPGDSWVAGTGY